jgi:ferredoxin
MLKIITKEDLDKTLTSLLSDFEIIGSRELSHKGIFYEPITDLKDLYWGEGFATEPVKKFFLSPWEYLFKGRYDHGKEVLEDLSLPENKRIIIGVRPCEAMGLTLLDKVFNAEEYKDEFYLNNRKRTILVGLSCLKPNKSCFCTSLGGSPASNRGLDALIFPVGNDLIIEIISESAKEIFDSKGRDLSKEETKAWEADKQRIKESLTCRIKVPESLDSIFESGYWGDVSGACVSCGICTFLCPTCHCFDLVDEKRKRLRCYDGCAFGDFTMEASGVNPRPSKQERYRQRVFHKFDYFKKNFKENLCVGCGRCIRHCPVKINIAEIVANAPIS